jgi:hypothetical protein
MVRLNAECGECVWQFRVKRGGILFRAQRSDMRKANQCLKDGRRNDSFLKVVRMVHKLTCKSRFPFNPFLKLPILNSFFGTGFNGEQHNVWVG